MTYAQVLALIQQFIIANGNNEITANVLRPILEDILTQPNEKMGDLIDLQTTDQSSLVAAINEALSLITPTIGSYNTKIHYLSLNGIDTNLPELTKIAEAVKIYGPFTCDAGQQMVFRTVLTVGNQANGIVVSRYYRLLRNMTTIGGPSSYVDIPPTWLMPDGVSEYSNPETNGSIVELGDIGTDNVWDAFNLGNNGEAWDMNEYRFVRATQNSEIMFWAFTGQERFYGGPDMNVEPDIFEAFENDFFLITDQPPAPDPGDGTIKTEDTVDIILTGDGTDANKLKATLQPTPNSTDIFGRTDDHWKPVVRRMEEDGQMWVEVLSPIGEILLQYSEQYFDEDTQELAGRNTLLNARFGVKTLKGQIDVNAIGFSAALDSQGNNINAQGFAAAQGSQGSDINALGVSAAQGSQGDNINAQGFAAAQGSQGDQINAIGFSSALTSQGDNINAIGYEAALLSEGSYINAFGVTAGRHSKGNDINVFGRSSYNLLSNPKCDRVNIFGPEIQPTKSDQNIISGEEFLMPNSTVSTVLAAGNKSLTTVETVNHIVQSSNGGGGGVQSVTGDGVGGTPEDVVMTFPTPNEIGAIEDAPSDGKQYARKNEDWEEVDGGQVLEESTSVKIVGDEIQRAALTGDVTAAQNSNELTISEGAVSNAKMENMAANTIKGRIASTDAPQDLNAEQVRTILNVENGAQKNVKTDWNATEGDAELLNKPTRVNFNIYNQTKNNAVTISNTVKTVINPLTTGSPLLPSTAKDSSYIGRIFGKFTSGGSSENITLEFKIANTTREVVFSNSDSSVVVFYVDYAINYLDTRTPTLSGVATVGNQSFLIDLDFETTASNTTYEISATLTGGTLVINGSYLHRNHN